MSKYVWHSIPVLIMTFIAFYTRLTFYFLCIQCSVTYIHTPTTHTYIHNKYKPMTTIIGRYLLVFIVYSCSQKWEVDGGIDLQSGTLVVHQSLSNDVNQNIVTPSDSIAAINGDDFTDDSDDDVYSLEYESVLTK